MDTAGHKKARGITQAAEGQKGTENPSKEIEGGSKEKGETWT